MIEFLKNNKTLVGAIVIAAMIYFLGGTAKDYFTGGSEATDSITNTVDTSVLDKSVIDSFKLDTINLDSL